MAFDVGSIVGYLELKKSKWDASIKSVKADQKSLSGLVARNSKQFKKMGKSMTIAGGVVVGAVTLMVKAYADFDEAMTESLAIMGDVSDEMRKDMANVARTISEETTFSAKELAAAYFYLASAGMDASQSMQVLGDVARFAQAGKFDLTTATDLLTDAQTAMNLSSKDSVLNQKNMIRVSDVLVGANTLANASVQQFAESLTTKAAAALVNVNKELEEGVAVLGAFADKGIKGRLAGTQLGMMLNALDLAAARNKKEWKALGLTLWTSTGEMKHIGDIIADLEDKLGDMTPEMRSATLMTLGFTVKTKASVLTLMGSSEKIKLWTKRLKEMGGLTKQVSDKQLETFNAQLKILRNVVMNAAISLGESLAPTIQDLIIDVKKVVKTVSEWIQENPKLTATIMKVAAGGGALMLVLGPLLIALPGIATGLKAIKFAGVGLGKQFTGLGVRVSGVKMLLGKLPAIGIAAFAGWKIGRLIGESTGLDKTLQGLFSRLIKVKSAAEELSDRSRILEKRQTFLADASKLVDKEITNVAEAIKILKDHYKKTGKVASEAMKDWGEETFKAEEKTKPLVLTAEQLLEQFAAGKITLEEYLEKLKALKGGHDDLNPVLKTTIGLLEYIITPSVELYRNFAEGKISSIELAEGLQKLREEAERIKNPFKDLAMVEGDVRIETEKMGDSFDVLRAAGIEPWLYDQLTAIEKLKLEAMETTDVITIRFKSMVEHVLDFTRDLSAGWADVFVDMLGITESITYQMKEFDNSYWENVLANAQETYEDKKSILEKQLEDAVGYYEDLESQLTGDYEKRKKWIEANVKDEEKKQEMLLKLEQKHQADLENARADQLKKEEDLQNQLVALEENHQIESDRIRSEEDAAREQHAIDEEKRQESLWNKVKGVFGDAVENMLYTWTTDFVQGMLLGAVDVAKGLISEIGGAFKTVKTDAVATGTKVTSELGGIAGTISGIGAGIASLITTLATAVATAATTLAAAAPALLIVLGIALAAYAGFKLISSLFKKKPETGTMEAILRDISHIQLAALLDKMDESNFFASEMFPKIDYTNSILAKSENLLRSIRGYSKKIESGISSMVKKLGDLSGYQTGIAYVPRTQLAVLHAGETVIPPVTAPPPGISKSSITGRGASPESGRQNVHISIKPLLIPRGDQYIVDFVIEDIKHGRKIPIEAIGG